MKNDLSAGLPLILVRFNTQCDYCRTEIDTIVDAIDLFGRAHILLISSEPEGVIRSFVESSKVRSCPKIRVLQDKDLNFARIFGASLVPRTLIYDSKWNLAGDYLGETKVEALLSHLH